MKRLLRFAIICLFVLLAAHMLYATQVSVTDKGDAAAQFNWGKKINVQIKNMLLPDALGILFKDTGITYKVEPDVAMLKVTADFKDISLQKALAELERVSNTFIILNSDSVSMSGDSWVTGTNTTVSVQKHLGTESFLTQVASRDITAPEGAHEIPLKYYTPSETLRRLRVPNWPDFLRRDTAKWTKASGPLPNTLPKEITSISARPDGKALFVTGEEAAVAKLTQLISKIDVEPREISLHITRYALGSVIPKGLDLRNPMGWGPGVQRIDYKITQATTESQLDALTTQLRGKGIEPIVTANIVTRDTFPAGIKVFGGGTASSSMSAHSVDLQVTPRLDPGNNGFTMSITTTTQPAVADEKSSQASTSTLMANINQGESLIIFEPADSPGGGALTIIRPTL